MANFFNMSRPLRDDDSTTDLSQEEKLIGVFYNIFSGNANKKLHFPRINIILIHLWWDWQRKSIDLSPKSFFWRRNNLSLYLISF